MRVCMHVHHTGITRRTKWLSLQMCALLIRFVPSIYAMCVYVYTHVYVCVCTDTHTDMMYTHLGRVRPAGR